jgi:hypothetical protein
MVFNIPVDVLCEPGTDTWKEGRTFKIRKNNSVLKNVRIWFSKGCSGKVYVRILRNGSPFLPNLAGIGELNPKDPTGYGYAYFGDDMFWPIHMPAILNSGEIIQIQYINSDNSNAHQIGVHFEIVMKPPTTSIDTEGTGTGRRRTPDAPAQEVNSTTLAQQVSKQAPAADRGAFAPIAFSGGRYGHHRSRDPREKVKYVQRYE